MFHPLSCSLLGALCLPAVHCFALCVEYPTGGEQERSKVEKTPTHSSDSKGHQQFGFTVTPPEAGDLCNYSTEQRHSPHTQSQMEMYSGFLTEYPICWEYFFLHQSAFSLVTIVAGVCHKQASKRKKNVPENFSV